jgi:hypothetical protein
MPAAWVRAILDPMVGDRIRADVGRLVLRRLIRTVALDALPLRRRSRRQRLRSGSAALLYVLARIVAQPEVLLALRQASGAPLRYSFHYGVRELRRAAAPPDAVRGRRAAIASAAAIGSAVAVAIVIARARADDAAAALA